MWLSWHGLVVQLGLRVAANPSIPWKRADCNQLLRLTPRAGDLANLFSDLNIGLGDRLFDSEGATSPGQQWAVHSCTLQIGLAIP